MTGRPSFAHLIRLSDATGVFEHALGVAPRPDHGYCVDDVARVLLVITREPNPSDAVASLGRLSLQFLVRAQAADGRFHNRFSRDAEWVDSPGVGDWWGRAVWALGVAAVDHPDDAVRAASRACFDLGVTRRSPFTRSMAFAALGAARVATAAPGADAALALLGATVAAIGRPRADQTWPWPEARLTYANAVLPEALLAAGFALGDERAIADGLLLLDWLLDVETRAGRLCPTAVGGWGPGEVRRIFDQQPIEAAAMADACSRAFACTGEGRWRTGLDRAIGWFEGHNHSNVSLAAPGGGGYDGLTAHGPNLNQGAESTIALISARQHARQREPASS